MTNHLGEPQSLGERLRHVRGQCGLSLDALAGRAEVSKSFLWEVENDRSGISGERLLRVANVLGASLDYLLRGSRVPGTEEPQPAKIPRELGDLAEELHLAYSHTVALLGDRPVSRSAPTGHWPPPHVEARLGAALRGSEAVSGGQTLRRACRGPEPTQE